MVHAAVQLFVQLPELKALKEPTAAPGATARTLVSSSAIRSSSVFRSAIQLPLFYLELTARNPALKVEPTFQP